MRNTLTALFECDAVPVINENDTISVDEIKFGDNDRLAAMVTNLLQAPLLVILSVVDGLYRADPGPDGRRRGRSRSSPTSTTRSSAWPATAGAPWGPAGCGASSRRRGWSPRPGGSVVIASGKKPEPLTRILAGEPVGTLFLARGATQAARKRWIGLTARPRGHFVVDAGRRRRPGDRARRACWPSASSRSSASSRRGTSSASATPTATSSPAA